MLTKLALSIGPSNTAVERVAPRRRTVGAGKGYETREFVAGGRWT